MTGAHSRDDDWPRLASLLDELLDIPPADRPAHIIELSAGDPKRRVELERVRVRGRQGAITLYALHAESSDAAFQRLEAAQSLFLEAYRSGDFETAERLLQGITRAEEARDRDLTGLPLAERRAELERLFADIPAPLHLTRTTRDVEVARRWLDEFEGAGLDGVVAKPLDHVRTEPVFRFVEPISDLAQNARSLMAKRLGFIPTDDDDLHVRLLTMRIKL